MNILVSFVTAHNSNFLPISPELVCRASGRNSSAPGVEVQHSLIESLTCVLEKNANAETPVRFEREFICRMPSVI